MPQGFFMKVTFNCDAGDVAGVLDQLQVGAIRVANVTVKNGKSPEDFAFTREQGPGPNRPNPKRHDAVAVIVPTGLAQDVGNVDRLPPINCGAAGCAFRADRREPGGRRKSRQTRSGSAIELL